MYQSFPRIETFAAACLVATVAGCGHSQVMSHQWGAYCPSDPSQTVEVSGDLSSSDAAYASAALALFATPSVSVENFASLVLPASLVGLPIDEATADVRAVPACGDGVWAGNWDLSLDDATGGWGDGDWDNDVEVARAKSFAAVDEATGDWTYRASLYRTWPGGPPLDAYGVEADQQIGLRISDHVSERVADGSDIDPTTPHWTLWTNMEAGGDMSIALASGPVIFVSPEDP